MKMSIEIGTYVAPVKANPYTETVEAMLKSGDNVAATIIVPVKDALKTRTAFSAAANAVDKTARVRVNEVVKGEGKAPDMHKFVFTLTTRHKARRGQGK